MKKILIAVGGTGGHVIPAEALAEDLMAKDPTCECLFVGAKLKDNPFFNKNFFKFREISSSPLSLKGCFEIYSGLKESRKILHHYCPDVVVGFGSYHSFPILLASVIGGNPIVLHAADIVPGKVIRFFSSFAKVSTVHFGDASKHLRSHTVQVKHPLRKNHYLASDKSEAYRYFALDPTKFTLLIFGGSQGANGINKLVKESLKDLKKAIPTLQVIHITGSLIASEEFEISYSQLNIPFYVKEFENKLDLAWKIADLGLVRAGAGTIAEHIEANVPCIFIPYPKAKDGHQEKNADFMMWSVGSGIKLLESKATSDVLVKKIEELTRNNGEKLRQMKHALEIYKMNTNPQDLSEIVMAAGIS